MINATHTNVGLYLIKLIAKDECGNEAFMYAKYLINTVPNVTASEFEVQYVFRGVWFRYEINSTFFWDMDEGQNETLEVTVTSGLTGDSQWINFQDGGSLTIQGQPFALGWYNITL